MLAGYILNASKPSYDIGDIAAEYLNRTVLSEDSFFGKGKSKRFDLPVALETGFALSVSQTRDKIYVSVLQTADSV
jgi:DNA polymerase I-like protein with 3'-5' exonuclease and polymerase domains